MKGIKGSKLYEKIGRKRIIAILIILIIVLSVITVSFAAQSANQNKKGETITYTENSYIGYKVHINENEFFEKDYLEENKQYIASLINYIDADFSYMLGSSKPNNNYNYNYKIVAEVNVEDETNKKSVYKFYEDLVPEKTLPGNNLERLQITDNVKIDYHKYNNIINKFISVYNLYDIKSTLTINMYVNVEGITTKVGTPVSSLVIPLTTKTMAIDIKSNTVNAIEIDVYEEIANNNKLYLAILTFILNLMIIIELNIFVNDTKDAKSVYKTRIKKILLNYESYIQKIESEFDLEGYRPIELKSFEDLLKVRDTISKPILMIETKHEKETEFLIPSEGKEIYIYKLKIEDLKNNKQKNNEQKNKKDTKEKLKV